MCVIFVKKQKQNESDCNFFRARELE